MSLELRGKVWVRAVIFFESSLAFKVVNGTKANQPLYLYSLEIQRKGIQFAP